MTRDSEDGLSDVDVQDTSALIKESEPYPSDDYLSAAYLPHNGDGVIDPRLRDYPIPLVARTVDLHNDET